jgi:acetyl-CoA synthetase
LSIASTSELRLHEALCDAHDPDGVALRYQVDENKVRELTYQELSERSCRLANALREEGNVRAGDVVAVMLPKGPAVMEVAVALARLGCVYQPLFTAFQPEGIRVRIGPSGAVAVITDASNRSKFRELLGDDKKVFCVGAKEAGLKDAWDYGECISNAAPLQVGHHQSPKIESDLDHPMALLYSSGTTGPPKGIMCPIKALENFRIYLEQGIGLRTNNQDRYWNIADSGWAYGLYYNVYGPLYVAQTAHMLATSFSPESTLEFLATHQIASFAAAPTVYRALCSLPDNVVQKYRNRISLTAASSAGEPLPPSVSEWFQQNLNVSILNHYGQTENGMMVNQHRAGPRRWNVTDPSSIGTPMEGFDGACTLNEHGEVIENVGEEGELCMKLSECSRLWFSGYFGRDTAVADEHGFYHTGDRARISEIVNGEKVFVFYGRDDDIINTAGYRCGPTEIENSIMQLDFVSDVGVVGFPDDQKGEVIEAFVVVNDQVGELDLAKAHDEIRNHVKNNLAKHLAPKIIKFLPSLPRTESGKVKRFILRKEKNSE